MVTDRQKVLNKPLEQDGSRNRLMASLLSRRVPSGRMRLSAVTDQLEERW